MNSSKTASRSHRAESTHGLNGIKYKGYRLALSASTWMPQLDTTAEQESIGVTLLVKE
ncbi:MAG: hypothetical protein ACUVRV_11265 [Cyanobacteriota bacterium]